jgi:general secretion pathway protein C
VKRHLFGSAHEGAAPGAPVASAARLTLKGVVSHAAPAAGGAILAAEGGKPQMVISGEDIAAGAVLREVHPDHVIILRNGVLERIDLERAAPRASQPPAPERPPAPVRLPAPK